MDKQIADETMKELDLPQIPTTIIEPKEEKKEEEKEKTRIAVLE